MRPRLERPHRATFCSGRTYLPALYETAGGYVVQGVVLDDDTTAQLSQVGNDETAVWVPANVLDRLQDL